MTARHGFYTVLAAAHLALVVCGATRAMPSDEAGLFGKMWDAYGWISGSGNYYGFFAPTVPEQIDAHFTVTISGEPRQMPAVNLVRGREAELRLSTLFEKCRHPLLRPLAARCWAGQLFARHPEANEVEVQLRLLTMPAMTAYRTGERPRWVTFYVARFAR